MEFRERPSLGVGCGSLCVDMGLSRPLLLSISGLASAELLFLAVISSCFQFPGWSQGPEGSLIIALGNEDALGEYSCTPYNSLGTAGPSPVTRVLLKVRLGVGFGWVAAAGQVAEDARLVLTPG